MTGQTLPWAESHLLALDVETTGVNVFEDRIVTLSTVYLAPGKRPRTQTWVVDPGVDIPPEAAAIHGWDTDRIRAHPDVVPTDTALAELFAYLLHPVKTGVPVVAYNAAFDCSIIDAECRRHDMATAAQRYKRGWFPVLDPFVMDRELDRFRRGKRTLSALCEHYGVILAGAHSSAGDALAAARLLRRLCEKYPDLAAMTPQQVHEASVGWHLQRQEDFAKYLTKQGKDASDVNGEWPCRSQPAAVAS